MTSIVSVPSEAITNGPEVQWNHVDGPLMHWAGHMYWLTWGERIRVFWFGLRAVDEIARERFPQLDRLRTKLKPTT